MGVPFLATFTECSLDTHVSASVFDLLKYLLAIGGIGALYSDLHGGAAVVHHIKDIGETAMGGTQLVALGASYGAREALVRLAKKYKLDSKEISGLEWGSQLGEPNVIRSRRVLRGSI